MSEVPSRRPRPGDLILDEGMPCTWLPALVTRVYTRECLTLPEVFGYAYTVDVIDAKGERMLPQDVFVETRHWPHHVLARGVDGVIFRVGV